MKKINCYGCKKDKFDFLLNKYELKKGGTVHFCVECENNAETYFDVIKRDCLIDGKSLEVTSKDEKEISTARKLRLEKEEEERKLDAPKSIYWFTNEPKKKPEINYQVLKYINQFLDVDEYKEEHIQRFKFNQSINKHWYFDFVEELGLSEVHIYLDDVKKEYQKVKKPHETEWRDRIRKWYSGRLQCKQNFYNVTFGFSQYDNEPIGEVYVNYPFLCSKSNKVARFIESLIEKGEN